MWLEPLQISVNIYCCSDSKSRVHRYDRKKAFNADQTVKNAKTKMKKSDWVNEDGCSINNIAIHHTQRTDQIPIDTIPLLPSRHSPAVSSISDYPTPAI
jgi:hypothetical protein